MIKRLGYFAIGFVCGSIATWTLTKKFVIDKITDVGETDSATTDDDNVDTSIDISETDVDGEKMVTAEKSEEEIPSYSEASDGSANKREKIFRYDAKKPRVIDYSKYGNRRTYMDEYEEQYDEEAVDELEMFSPSEGLANEPEYISPNSFLGEYDHFDKIEMKYYEGDDVLAEIDGTIELDVTEDVRYTLPSDYREHFGDYLPEQVNIRAHKISTDYEIVRTRGSFYEDEEGDLE